MTETTQDDALHLTRTIPTPSSVSAEAQAAISMGAALVPSRLANPQPSPALDDNAAWKARIAVMDEAILTGFAARGDTGHVDVEKIDVDGIDVYVIMPAGADTTDDA